MPSTTPQDRKPPRKKGKQKHDRTTPIPVPEPEDSRYAPDSWMSGGHGGTEELQVPSGQLCLVRRPGMEGLMRAGVLANADSLSAIVNEKHIKRVDGKKTDEIDADSLVGDEEALEEISYVVDKVICYCVVRPQVHMTPGDVTRRKQGVVYADMIDLVDKMFIFNHVVGGTRDLERFRGELEQSLGSLDAVEDVPVSTQ